MGMNPGVAWTALRLFSVAAPLLGMGVLAGCNGGGYDDEPPVEQPVTPQVIGAGEGGLVNGAAAVARFRNPANVEAGPDGTIYVADFDNNVVRAIAVDGTVRTLVARSNFERPFGLTFAPDGNLYVQTDSNDSEPPARDVTTGTIWRVTPAGVATVVVRNVGRPRGLLALDDGRIVLSDLVQNTISLLDPGTGVITVLAGTAGAAGFADGTGTAAQFNRPYGMARASDGALLVADQGNHRIRKVTLAGVVTTFAGTGTAGSTNGTLAAASFNGPQDVAVRGNVVYVADTLNFLVRRIADGSVTTIAGTGTRGFAAGEGATAQFAGLEGFDLTDNGATLWIADGNGGEGDDFNRVRRITAP